MAINSVSEFILFVAYLGGLIAIGWAWEKMEKTLCKKWKKHYARRQRFSERVITMNVSFDEFVQRFFETKSEARQQAVNSMRSKRMSTLEARRWIIAGAAQGVTCRTYGRYWQRLVTELKEGRYDSKISEMLKGEAMATNVFGMTQRQLIALHSPCMVAMQTSHPRFSKRVGNWSTLLTIEGVGGSMIVFTTDPPGIETCIEHKVKLSIPMCFVERQDGQDIKAR